MEGLYITFEGPEGCGKSTQLKMLAERLGREGYPIAMTKEPGGTPAGVLLRKIILDPEYKAETADPYFESMLFWTDRRTHHGYLVRPALARGETFLGDRDKDSSWAYQHFGRGIPREWMSEMERLVIGDFTPALTLLYTGDVDHFLTRVGRRNKQDANTESRIDDEQLDFHLRVQAGFLELAHEEPDRFRILDGMKGIDELHEETYMLVKPVMERHYGF